MAEYWILVLGRHEGERRVHERVLPVPLPLWIITASGRSSSLETQARYARLVRLFADDPQPVVVGQDPAQQLGVVEQCQGRVAIRARHFHGRGHVGLDVFRTSSSRPVSSPLRTWPRSRLTRSSGTWILSGRFA